MRVAMGVRNTAGAALSWEQGGVSGHGACDNAKAQQCYMSTQPWAAVNAHNQRQVGRASQPSGSVLTSTCAVVVVVVVTQSSCPKCVSRLTHQQLGCVGLHGPLRQHCLPHVPQRRHHCQWPLNVCWAHLHKHTQIQTRETQSNTHRHCLGSLVKDVLSF